ncbi:MAG: NUDIX domain-containing protein [Micrococcaceae bacterium]|nr:NUDIX domain-containing protein [Micrococcaceae bacterium]
MSEGPRLVPASYVVFRRADQVLLQLRQGTGYMDGCWAAAAAGHVEAGESAVQAAVREAREELGVSLDSGQLVPLTTMHRGPGPGVAEEPRVDFFFGCEQLQGRPRLMEPDKSADLCWFSLDDLPHPVVPHERYVFERLAAGLPALTTFGFDTP